MKKGIFFNLLGITLATAAYGSLNPVVTLSVGADAMHRHSEQNITLIAPFQNTYRDHLHATTFVAGAFVGVEIPFTALVSSQIGVSYYHSDPAEAHGTIYQFADPQLNDLGYTYEIHSQRVFLEGKLLSTWYEHYHPFFTVGLGQARNKTSNYREFPLSSDSLPMGIPFANQSHHGFAYFLGLGLERELSNQCHIGVSYRWQRLNRARLGTTPLQESTNTLVTRLSANTFLFHISYVR